MASIQEQVYEIIQRKLSVNPEQITPEAATHAPIGQVDDTRVTGRGQQFGVDANRAEVVDDHTEPAPRWLPQETVQQRRLSGPEVAADHRDRNRGSSRNSHDT